MEADADIIRRLAAGDQTAVADLLGKHGPSVSGVLRKVCPFVRDVHVVESALHDAAIAVWKVAQRLEPDMSLGAYFYKVCYRRLLRLSRKDPPMKLVDPVLMSLVAAPGQRSGEPSATASGVTEALQHLSPQEAEVLAADIASNFRDSAAAIAKALGTSIGTVYGARNRTKAKLAHLAPATSSDGQSTTEGP